MNAPPRLATFERPQRIVGRVELNARMTVVPLAEGELALVSPVAIDEPMAEAIAALGEVRFLVAPNLYHHLHLAGAVERYPRAKLLAPPGLGEKRADLRVDATLDAPLDQAIADYVDVVRLSGAPSIDEFVLYHRATRTLIVTDLVFHVLEPEGFATNLVLTMMGTRGRLAASRMWGFLTRDREALHQSLARMMSLPFSRVVLAHGECLEVDARARLAEALRHRFGAELPA